VASIPVASVPGVVLSLTVDDQTRMVTGYTVDREPDAGLVEINLSAGNFSIRQTFGIGRTSANIPRNRQWNFDGDTDMAYGITNR
jgi:hypothetical protein